ncbi:isoaspartyl peptidase/L-asparaginase, partial [Staphylococcus aureus]
TSTGGLTNKLTGRIGDTPTVGAGFWAEEWDDEPTTKPRPAPMLLPAIAAGVTLGLDAMRLMADCLPVPCPFSRAYESLPCSTET